MPKRRRQPDFKSAEKLHHWLIKWGNDRGVFDSKLVRLYRSVEQLTYWASDYEKRLQTFSRGDGPRENLVKNRNQVIRNRRFRALQAREKYHEQKKAS